ncbi:MAG: Ig-like domain-containing protein [Candidatus Poribacteria bacterium]|nr:Ig-like domain-containing protein [Candidatus Poribacteria bacterium]
MRNTSVNQKIIVSILTASLGTLLILISCGGLDDNSQPTDDNSQPTIELISDQTIDMGDEKTVRVNITDPDVDDTHIVRASSDKVSVAIVLVDGATLTLKGIASGTATITVYVPTTADKTTQRLHRSHFLLESSTCRPV